MCGKAALMLALIVLALSAVRPSESSGPPQIHRVATGDTLWSIAEKYYGGDPREGVWRLQETNGVDAASLRVGQRLVVP